MILHVTNGHATALAETSLGGEVVYWQDVLHEGPVPATLPLEALSGVRAEFIASRGWSDRAGGLADFGVRDRAIREASRHEEVVLWFEFDLYDQLQLIQILDTLHGIPLDETIVTLICLGSHPEVEDFRGLGQLNPAQLEALFPDRQPVPKAAWDLARVAWHAFREDSPLGVAEIAAMPDSGALPFLARAFRRHLVQFPAVSDGLMASERLLLEALRAGPLEIGAVYRRSQAHDALLGLGDLSFVTEYLGPLAAASEPILELAGGGVLDVPLHPPTGDFWQQRVQITPPGQEILAGARDACTIRTLDRWFGGVHLTGPAPAWRWDADSGRILQT